MFFFFNIFAQNIDCGFTLKPPQVLSLQFQGWEYGPLFGCYDILMFG